MRSVAPAWTAFDLRTMFQGFTTSEVTRLTNLLGHAPRRYDAFAAETAKTWFSGAEGVLGALGVYRAAFATIAQTPPLQASKVKVPVVALGGEKGLGAKVGHFVSMAASEVSSLVLPDCGTLFRRSARTLC